MLVYYDEAKKLADVAERKLFRNGEKILSFQPADTIQLWAPYV